MNMPLFRRQALDARQDRWMGAPSPIGGFVGAWAVLLVAAAAVALGVFLALGEYSRRARVTGRLVSDLGLPAMTAPVAGVVERVFQEEGAQVAAGTPLLLVRVPRTLATGVDQAVALRAGLLRRREELQAKDAALAARHEAQMAGHRLQLEAARRELAQLGAETAHRREQLRIAREHLARYERVAEARLVSQALVHQQRQAVLELAGLEQALLRQATGIRRELLRLRQALRELPAQRKVQEADHALQLAALEGERIERQADGEWLLKAPVAGVVAQRMVEAGQTVQAGQPLLDLLPRTSTLQAQLHVPSRAAGFVAAGDRVLLRYAAYPHQKFGHHEGRVLRVSRSAVDPEALRRSGIGLAAPGETYYRVLVALDRQYVLAYGRREPLRPGMSLEADILGDRRKLYEWLLEPLYSLRGRVAASAPGAG